MEVLEDAGETEGTRLCPYIKENKWENIQYKINGYAIEEGFETLDIFISSYSDGATLDRLPKSDLDKIIKWTTGFVNVALKGYFEEIEPSSEAHGLAKLIFDNRKDFIRINIFIISNRNIPHDPPKNFRLKGYDDLVFNFNIWDAERLHRLSQSKNNREPIVIDFEENLGHTIPCLSMPSENDLYECYLAIVPGTILATLYRNYGTRLLESNVRAFLQQTGKVNKGIRDTIKEEPYMFLPYNNGLATTAQEVKTKVSDSGQLLITGVKDFQIVNGGQTTASIFHTEKKFKSDISKVFVQMKLTVIKDEEKKNETVPYISRFANSQNKVSELDLTSNNPFLQRIEELSRTTYAVDPDDSNKQTIWFFERVKGQYREAINKEPTKGKKDAFTHKYPRNQLIIKSEIAKFLNIWFQKPFHVSKGAQKNYNFFLKEVESLFKKDKPNRGYWQDIVSNAIIFKTADGLFGRKNQDPIGDTNIKSHTVAYSLSYIHFLTENKLNLDLIWDKQLIDENLKSEIKRVLIYVYQFLSSLDVALISEAAKAEKTWTLLKDKKGFELNNEIIKGYLASESYDVKKRYKSVDEGIEETKKYNNLERITSLGLRFWDGLSLFNISNSVLSPYQSTVVSKIANKLQFSGTISEREIEKGVEIIKVLTEKGLEFNKVSALSKLDKDEIVDASSLFNRISELTDNDWNRVISLGEQTQTLSFNEISVIRSVISKLKHKEDIDFKRLGIVETALKKLKKFGVKY
ncbi:MAG: AIPR family protein [Cyclobacteriaceae bacterium]